MIAGIEQRNAYKGVPPRPWIGVRLISSDGELIDLQLIADTGSPCSIIVGEAVMRKFRWTKAGDRNSNFGTLHGGWLKLEILGFHSAAMAIGYSSDVVAQTARASHDEFGGLIGLPLLRNGEFGGDRHMFWIRNSPK